MSETEQRIAHAKELSINLWKRLAARKLPVTRQDMEDAVFDIANAITVAEDLHKQWVKDNRRFIVLSSVVVVLLTMVIVVLFCGAFTKWMGT